MNRSPSRANQSKVLVAAVFLITAWQAMAQNEVKSTHLTQSLKGFVENLTAAQSSEQAAQSKTAELTKAAQAAAAQIGDLNLPPQARHQAYARVIELQIQAVRGQLEAAKQSTTFLAAAKNALGEIRSQFSSNVSKDANSLPTPEEEAQVDDVVGNINLLGDEEIDRGVAEALADARTYYQLACKETETTAMVQTLVRCVRALEAKNRRAIVLADARLCKLQLAAACETIRPQNTTSNSAALQNWQSCGIQRQKRFVGPEIHFVCEPAPGLITTPAQFGSYQAPTSPWPCQTYYRTPNQGWFGRLVRAYPTTPVVYPFPFVRRLQMATWPNGAIQSSGNVRVTIRRSFNASVGDRRSFR
jgi:hypothetical protein